MTKLTVKIESISTVRNRNIYIHTYEKCVEEMNLNVKSWTISKECKFVYTKVYNKLAKSAESITILGIVFCICKDIYIDTHTHK